MQSFGHKKDSITALDKYSKQHLYVGNLNIFIKNQNLRTLTTQGKYMSFLKKSILIATLGLSSMGAIAAEDDAGFAAGLKFGKTLVDIEGADDGTTKGITLGYSFNGNWAVELDVMRGDFEVDGDSGDLDWTAIYGAYRSEGSVYFLAKIGAAREEASIYGESETDTGASYGIGGGFRVNDTFSLEAEYTIIESDVNFLGIGARFQF